MTGRPADPGTGLGGGEADDPAGHAPGRAGRHALAVLPGCRHPVVVILLLISFFATISGKPLDGLLMLVVAVALAWDAGQRRRASGPAAAAAGATGSGPAAPAPGGAAAAGAATAPADAPAAGPAGSPGGFATCKPGAGTVPVPTAPLRHGLAGRWLVPAAWVAGGISYAAVVGSFIRYSWPATIAVVGLVVPVVVLGWRGALRERPDPGPLPVVGAAAWGGVLVAGGLWELSALLQQPSLTVSSYPHPTISSLTDPLLAAAGGRSLVLAAWLALGWYLVRR